MLICEGNANQIYLEILGLQDYHQDYKNLIGAGEDRKVSVWRGDTYTLLVVM